MSNTSSKDPSDFKDPDPFGYSEQEYEDGTNIALGTPFREEFTTRTLPWYVPTEAKGSLNWKEDLITLRKRFSTFTDQHYATECLLIQTIIPQIGKSSRKPTETSQERQFLSSGQGQWKEPAKLFGVQRPLTAAFAMMNVRGEQFLDPDNKPLPFRLGFTRYFTIQAVPDGLRSLPIPTLEELLGDGKNALLQLPTTIAIKIWRNWLSGFSQRHSKFLWLDALFELAWQREGGSQFHVERYAWADNASIALTGLGLFPRLPKFVTAASSQFCPHENGYPRTFYSGIPDIARASIAAIDEVLENDSQSSQDYPSTNACGNMKTTRSQVFISYSHKDVKFLNELLTHLKPIERSDNLTSWSDKEIEPGSKWFDEIQKALAQAKVAVLLVSPDFLASEFINEHELTPLLKKAEEDGVCILWIPIKASAYKKSPIQKYQALVLPEKPLAKMRSKRDEVWVKICEDIHKAVAK